MTGARGIQATVTTIFNEQTIHNFKVRVLKCLLVCDNFNTDLKWSLDENDSLLISFTNASEIPMKLEICILGIRINNFTVVKRDTELK